MERANNGSQGQSLNQSDFFFSPSPFKTGKKIGLSAQKNLSSLNQKFESGFLKVQDMGENIKGFFQGEEHEHKYLLDDLADKHRDTSKMDQATKEITPEDGRGIRSNIILDGTKTNWLL